MAHELNTIRHSSCRMTNQNEQETYWGAMAGPSMLHVIKIVMTKFRRRARNVSWLSQIDVC